jgi:hypothetical protein
MAQAPRGATLALLVTGEIGVRAHTLSETWAWDGGNWIVG